MSQSATPDLVRDHRAFGIAVAASWVVAIACAVVSAHQMEWFKQAHRSALRAEANQRRVIEKLRKDNVSLSGELEALKRAGPDADLPSADKAEQPPKPLQPVKIKPSANDAYIEGLIHYRKNQYAQAVERFTKAIDSGEPIAPMYLARGHAMVSLGNFSDAISDYTQAIAIGGGATRVTAYEWRALCRGVYCQNRERDLANAIRDLEEAVALDASKVTRLSLTYLIGWLCTERLELRDGERAIRYARILEERGNLKSEDILLIAAAYGEAGEFDIALDWIDQAIQDDPTTVHSDYRKLLLKGKKFPLPR